MAFNYQGYASLAVNLNRQKYGPLDISSVFISEADLKYYLTRGKYKEGVSKYWYENENKKIVPYPYEGQIVATVINRAVEVYVLYLGVDDTFQTQKITTNIDQTIIAEIQADINALKAALDGENGLIARVNGLQTAVDEIVSNDLASRLAALEKKEVVTKTELATSVAEALQSANTYTDSKIAEVYTTISGINHFTTKIVTSVNEVKEPGVLYLIKDNTATGSDKYNEYLYVDGYPVLIGDTSTDLSNYYTKAETASLVENGIAAISTQLALEVDAREKLAKRVETLEQEAVRTADFNKYKEEVTQNFNAIVQPKASDEIAVANDGQLSVNEVTITKISQPEGHELILNGGNA